MLSRRHYSAACTASAPRQGSMWARTRRDGARSYVYLQRSGELLPLLLGLAAPLALAPLMLVPRRSELASTCSAQRKK